MNAKQNQAGVMQFGAELLNSYGGFFALAVVLIAVFCIALGQ